MRSCATSRRSGAAILIVSSEFEELLGLADRVVVISDGLSIARRAERLSRRGEAHAARRAAQLRWSAISALLAGARGRARRRRVLGDPRRGARLLPQRGAANPARRSRLSRRRDAAVRRDADRRRARGAREPISCVDPDKRAQEPGGRRQEPSRPRSRRDRRGRSGSTRLRRPPRRCAPRIHGTIPRDAYDSG